MKLNNLLSYTLISNYFLYCLLYQLSIFNDAFEKYVYASRILVYCLSSAFFLIYVVVKGRFNKFEGYMVVYTILISMLLFFHGENSVSIANSVLFFPINALAISICVRNCNLIGIERLKTIAMLGTIALIIQFFVTAIYFRFISVLSFEGSVYGYLINTVYFPVLSLSMLIHHRNKLISLLLCFVVIGLCAFVGKTTPLIIAVIFTLAISYSIYSKHFSFKSIFLLVNLFLSAIILWLLYLVVATSIIDNVNVNDISSGRIEIVTRVISEITTFTVKDWIFGKGITAMPQKYGISSHNDYVEVLYGFGLIGLMLYLGIYLFIIEKSFNYIARKKYDYFLYSFLIFIAIFLGSFSTHFIFVASYLPLVLYSLFINDSANVKYN